MCVFRKEFPEHPCLALPPFNTREWLAWAEEAYVLICSRRGQRKTLAEQLADANAEIARLKAIIAAVPAEAAAAPPPSPPPTPEPQAPALPVLSKGKTVPEALADWQAFEGFRHLTTRQLDDLKPGLGQRFVRTKRVVCACWCSKGLHSAVVGRRLHVSSTVD